MRATRSIARAGGCLLAACLLLAGCNSYTPNNAALSRPIPPRDPSASQQAPFFSSSAPAMQPPARSGSEDTSSSTTLGHYDPNAAPPVYSGPYEEPLGEEPQVQYIGDKFFATQMNDIWLNPEDYIAKTIRYEGKFYEHPEPVETGEIFRMVYRYTNGGCCGMDGMAGIELIGEYDYPPNDVWVEITCVPELADVGYPNPLLRLRTVEIRVLKNYGLDYVPD